MSGQINWKQLEEKIGAVVKLKDTHTGNTLCPPKHPLTLPKVAYPKPNIHASLVARGIQSELLIYDDEGHGLAKRANRLDALPKMLAFLRKNLNI